MFSSLANDRSSRFGSTWILLLAALSLLAVLAGCGGGDKADEAVQEESVVVANVGDAEITADYYEDRLAKLQAEELPREDGVALDMSTEAGKRAFLDVLINKELMVQKAMQLGYDQDVQVQGARLTMTEYEAGMAMWNDFVKDVGSFVSEEELAAFYENMGTEYQCEYLICNFEEDALEAREAALGGMDWEDLSAKYHDGKPAPNGVYRVAIPFGHYSPYFEDAVFATEKGGVTMPIKSNYGYWVLRVVDIVHNPKPDLEDARAQILDVSRNRKIGSKREEERDRIYEKYELKINEDALWTVYQGLPPEGLMDPATNQPYERDKLKPLDIPASEMGEVLFSYRDDEGGLVETTVATYKEKFDQMNTFQRPKKDEMLGNLRLKIMDQVGKSLMNIEARKRGFFEDPDVVQKVDLKIEEMIVNRLFSEVVTFDDNVSMEQLQAFWDDHSDEYKVPEMRSGHLVVCKDREAADRAHDALSGGTAWRQVLAKYDTDPTNKKQGGMTGSLRADSKSPAAGPLFALEDVGALTEPFPFRGKWAVAQLDAVTPPKAYELAEVTEAIGGRIKKGRQEESFRALLEKWTQEFGVEIHSENLAGLKSWEELTSAAPTPEHVVPRN